MVLGTSRTVYGSLTMCLYCSLVPYSCSLTLELRYIGKENICKRLRQKEWLLELRKSFITPPSIRRSWLTLRVTMPSFKLHIATTIRKTAMKTKEWGKKIKKMVAM